MRKCTDYLFVNLICLFVCALPYSSVISQDLLDDINAQTTLGDNAGTFSETVKIISRSGKIFILSNSNQMLNKGDFITLILKEDKGPIARAVVAKTHDGNAGIKALKVYSLARWKALRKDLDIDIKKGDDSSLFKKKVENNATTNDRPTIENEEDLFNDTVILEDSNGFYKDKRHIKPDNVVSAGWDQYSFVSDVDQSKFVGNQWNFAWAFQFADNYWIEGLYGNTTIDGFPDDSFQTVINNFTARVKYTFKAPLYSYFIPYIGIQSYQVSSPEAGIPVSDTDAAKEVAQRENDTLNKLRQTNLVVGVTVLRRLVPGWFLKADLGTDILSFGFAIEF